MNNKINTDNKISVGSGVPQAMQEAESQINALKAKVAAMEQLAEKMFDEHADLYSLKQYLEEECQYLRLQLSTLKKKLVGLSETTA